MRVRIKAKLNTKQLERLSDLFLDLAKGSFAGAVALPLISRGDLLIFGKLTLIGIITVFFSLMLLREKKA